ncbi:MAG: TonB-dependent receptor plug domain-containing protein [Chlorobi bacterium]|nr:TonB-dependent receptor plug domain-containing protein [Chlorobiota bacterium]
MKKITLFFSFWVMTLQVYSQSVIKGKVFDQNDQSPLVGVNILEKGTDNGTATDFNGAFKLNVSKFPATLIFSYLGYATKEITVQGPVDNLTVYLAPSAESLNDVVITASKTRERVLESPVTVERLSAKAIPYVSAPSFYEDLANLRGVQINTNSFTFQALNTRGFATFANNRVLQLIDGLDNSSPALNFPLGNLVGISDLDVDRVELLPGTSSALYGANAFNGLINITSKSPFKYQGLSVLAKGGVTVQEAAGVRPMYEAAVRYAKAFDKFAFKVNMSYLQATDWFAVDSTDTDRSLINKDKRGSRESNPSYDGMNIYGDEVATDIDLSGHGLGVIRVSRTGYKELDLTDYQAKSIKGDVALHYKPKGADKDLELIWSSRFGGGQTIYQGANRYNLKDLFIHQHKLELKNKNYFVRAYYTSEDAGNSYDTRFAAWNINRAWKSDRDWFTQYATVYAGAILGSGLSEEEAHKVARETADNGRLKPGTPEFQKVFDQVVSDPDFRKGAKFVDHTSLFHVEGNYEFTNIIPNGNIQVGGSYRQYSLRSDGTIFTDYDGPIFIRERAVFAQYIQKLMDGHLKFNGSVRFDKQNDFKVNFSPRVALVWLPDEEKKHSLRVAYQTGFRYPTTQDLYIGLNIGYATLVGAAPDNWDRYSEENLDNNGNTYTLTGRDVYTNSYTLTSFMKFAQTHNPADLEAADVRPIGPEHIQSFEFGYRGDLGKGWNVDMVAYTNHYEDFIANYYVMAIPKSYGDVHDNSGLNAVVNGAYKPASTYTNSDIPIDSYGLDISIVKHWDNGYNLNLVYDYAKLDFDKEAHPDVFTYFNTPENTFKATVSNWRVYKNFGFSLSYKFMDKFIWESSFATGPVPAHSTVDAMISYKLPEYNMMFKLGGSNILGKEYIVAPGTGHVGSVYYLSFLYKL